MQFRTRIAAIAAAAGLALAGAGAVAASPAFACAAPANCTNGSVTVNGTIGTSGFPTQFSAAGNAGTTVTATASQYSVYANQPWTLTFSSDSADLLGGGLPAYWAIPGTISPGPDTFPIYNSTTITHNGVLFSLPSGNGVTSVQIDSGGPVAGGQGFADVFSVAIPQAQPPGTYQAAFQYILAG